MSDLEPIGSIELCERMYDLSNGWRLCDGSVMATAQWPDLFAAIGTKYGGDAQNFKLPAYGYISDTAAYVIRVE